MPFPGSHSLDMSTLNHRKHGFLKGLQLVVRAERPYVPGVPPPDFELYQELPQIFADVVSCAVKGGHMQTLEDKLCGIIDSSSTDGSLYNFISGYACGETLCVISKTWKRWASISDCDCWDSEDQHFLRVLGHCLKNLNGVASWFSQCDNDESGQLYCKDIVEAGIFWQVQNVLYLLHTYTLIRTRGIVRSRQMHRLACLPWQLGWFQYPTEVVRLAAALLSMREKC
jgi:hypothetical protein